MGELPARLRQFLKRKRQTDFQSSGVQIDALESQAATVHQPFFGALLTKNFPLKARRIFQLPGAINNETPNIGADPLVMHELKQTALSWFMGRKLEDRLRNVFKLFLLVVLAECRGYQRRLP